MHGYYDEYGDYVDLRKGGEQSYSYTDAEDCTAQYMDTPAFPWARFASACFVSFFLGSYFLGGSDSAAIEERVTALEMRDNTLTLLVPLEQASGLLAQLASPFKPGNAPEVTAEVAQ